MLTNPSTSFLGCDTFLSRRNDKGSEYMGDATIAFNGACAYATSLGREGIGDPRTAIVRNGTTYHFQNSVAKLLFRILPGQEKKAHARWEAKQ
jgi:hypothetical protein